MTTQSDRNAAALERDCVHFLKLDGFRTAGTCEVTGFVFSGNLEVGQCSSFVNKSRKKRERTSANDKS
jgi:hypothetical protein